MRHLYEVSELYAEMQRRGRLGVPVAPLERVHTKPPNFPSRKLTVAVTEDLANPAHVSKSNLLRGYIDSYWEGVAPFLASLQICSTTCSGVVLSCFVLATKVVEGAHAVPGERTYPGRCGARVGDRGARYALSV